jgi:UDP-galactopyranose mutase
MKYFICLVIITLILTKKKSKKTKSAMDHIQSHNLTIEGLCLYCKETIEYVSKKLKGKTKESDVIDFFDSICKFNEVNKDNCKYCSNIVSDAPANMDTGCELFVHNFREELENVFINRNHNDDVLHKFCWEVTEVY